MLVEATELLSVSLGVILVKRDAYNSLVCLGRGDGMSYETMVCSKKGRVREKKREKREADRQTDKEDMTEYNPLFSLSVIFSTCKSSPFCCQTKNKSPNEEYKVEILSNEQNGKIHSRQ